MGLAVKPTKEIGMKFWNKITKNERGQGVLEYVIISGLIGVFCLVAVGKFGKTVKNKIEQMDKRVSGKLLIN